jgi:flavorubredoxin
VLYASAYGNTAALAQALARGVTKAGVGVDMLNLETETLENVTSAVTRGNGFLIGSPTLGGHMPTQVQVSASAKATRLI